MTKERRLLEALPKTGSLDATQAQKRADLNLNDYNAVETSVKRQEECTSRRGDRQDL